MNIKRNSRENRTADWRLKTLCGLMLLGCTSLVLAGGAPDTVEGAARFDSVGAKVEITAKSDPDGANASGRFRLRQGALDFVGEITCLAVTGNWASAGGTITRSEDPSRLGDTFFQLTRDNGEGRRNSDESQTLLIGGNPQDCASHVEFDPRYAVDRGNYVVKNR